MYEIRQLLHHAKELKIIASSLLPYNAIKALSQQAYKIQSWNK